MKKVCFIQPLIANYCIPVFAELGKHVHLTIVYSPIDARQGFGSETEAIIPGVNTVSLSTWWPRFGQIGMVQSKLIRYLHTARPDAVIIFANLRYLSFWTTLAWCKIHGIPVFPHGQGLYKKRAPGFFWKVIYRALLWLSSAYISYTSSVAESLLRLNLPREKIVVAENSLVNPFPIKPEEKMGQERGILFVGRLRENCGLALLIGAVARLRSEYHSSMTLHIVGDGIDAEHIQGLAGSMPWVKFYGSVYDSEKISKISRQCMAGCYPGDAGLSVVHLMSLSLPPITHDEIQAHQGPEPSYIESGLNGVLFDHQNSEVAIVNSIRSLLDNPIKLKSMQASAYATYEKLTHPSLAMRFLNILDLHGRERD